MTALLESLSAGFEGDAVQRATLNAILAAGLPHARSEAWKYTSLRSLERRSFKFAALQSTIDGKLLVAIPSPRLVFVNGAFYPALSDVSNLPAGVDLRADIRDPAATAGPCASLPRADDVFAGLNAMLSVTGATLRVAADVECETPVHLVFIGASAESDHAWHLRNEIALGPNARLTVVEHHLAGGGHAHLANSVTRIELQANARLSHVRLQREAPAATCLLRTDAVLGERARYERLDLELGAALSRHELNVRLEGDGSILVASNVLLAQGRRHLDTRIGIGHVGQGTVCDVTSRGLGAGRGRVVFHGGITIQAGADGSDARLSSKNLLLSDNAEIDTQPVLEIHADEVKAAHGATVGQLDANAIFYLRTRGLPEVDARRLLTAAFCREPLGIVVDDALRGYLVAAVDAALAELPAA